MRIPFFPRRHRTLEELESIRESRSQGIRRVLGVSGIIFLACVAFLVSLLVLPPLVELRALEQERDNAERQLIQAQAEEARQQSINSSMADPEFFEHQARDRGDLAKEGEIVIRRPAPTASPMKNPPRRN